MLIKSSYSLYLQTPCRLEVITWLQVHGRWRVTNYCAATQEREFKHTTLSLAINQSTTTCCGLPHSHTTPPNLPHPSPLHLVHSPPTRPLHFSPVLRIILRSIPSHHNLRYTVISYRRVCLSVIIYLGTCTPTSCTRQLQLALSMPIYLSISLSYSVLTDPHRR